VEIIGGGLLSFSSNESTFVIRDLGYSGSFTSNRFNSYLGYFNYYGLFSSGFYFYYSRIGSSS
jgi:hypothetical protein